MTQLLTIFITGYVSVFALGFQSRNVNHGNYLWAAGTSMFVGMSQAFLWKHIMVSDSFAGAVTYSLAGSIAIVSSMFVHDKYIKDKGKKQ